MEEVSHLKETRAELRQENSEVFDTWDDLCLDIDALETKAKNLVREYAEHLKGGSKVLFRDFGQVLIVTRAKMIDVPYLMKLHPGIEHSAKISMRMSVTELDRLVAAEIVDEDDAKAVQGFTTRISIKTEMEDVE